MSIYSIPTLPPLPQTPRRSPVGAIIAWIAIIACVGLIASRALKPPKNTAPVDVKDWDPARLPSLQLKIQAQYIIEMKQQVAPAPQPSPAGTADMLRQLEQSARVPLDQLRTIPIAGEVLGREAAIDRLDAFEKRHLVIRLRQDIDILRAIYARQPQKLTPQQEQYLVARHGWFGKVALSWQQPDSAPTRREMLKSARFTVTLSTVALLAGGGGVLVGLILLIVGIVWCANGALAVHYRRPEPDVPTGVFAEAFALYMALFLGISALIAWSWPTNGLASSFLMVLIVPASILWIRMRGVKWPRILDGIGWRKGQGILREMGLGIAGYVAGLPIVCVGFIATAILMMLFKQAGQAGHPIQNEPMQTWWDVTQLILLAGVWAPLTEETLFRGALVHHLRAGLPWWLAAIINSLLFAAIHPQGWVAIPVLAALAFVFSGLREWRGSLIAPMTAHGFSNAIMVLLMWLLSAN